ncbi:DUF421 domain-containing protein [Candidatus Micrarchaeota archaeon]|nr:DUF421 domain-containing protein [Candidatus Micrarchaeota archaeon]
MPFFNDGGIGYQLLRVLSIYVFTLVMLRLAGKRGLTRLSAFDILIIIALGSAVGDVMIYSESTVPILNSMLAIFLVVAMQILLTKLMEHNPLLGYLIEGRSTLIIFHGNVVKKNLEKEDLTLEELHVLLREKGVSSISEVREAYLESSGELSVILKKKLQVR